MPSNCCSEDGPNSRSLPVGLEVACMPFGMPVDSRVAFKFAKLMPAWWQCFGHTAALLIMPAPVAVAL
jgi:hypothetical protein